MVVEPLSVHTVGDLRTASGGPSRSVTAVCDAIARAGAPVTLISAETDARQSIVRPKEPEVAFELLATNARAGLWRGATTPFGHAVGSALSSAYAIVHTHGLWVPANRAAALAARRTGHPLIVSPKGMLSDRALRVKRAKKQLGWHLYQRKVLREAAAFQATSEAEADDLRRLGFRQPIAVIPHGVARGPRRREPPQRGELRTALFLSRFHPIKGVPDLIRAWAQVRPEGWRLVLAGPDEGGHRGDVERLVAACGLGDAVSFRGAVAEEEKGDLFDGADLFVLATHSENFGAVVAEALAAGLPVITTRGAPWQALEAHRCGWWTEVGPDAFSRALREATSTSPETLHAMGARGQAYARSALSWDRSGHAHLALYRWLLGKGPCPSFIRLAERHA